VTSNKVYPTYDSFEAEDQETRSRKESYWNYFWWYLFSQAPIRKKFRIYWQL